MNTDPVTVQMQVFSLDAAPDDMPTSDNTSRVQTEVPPNNTSAETSIPTLTTEKTQDEETPQTIENTAVQSDQETAEHNPIQAEASNPVKAKDETKAIKDPILNANSTEVWDTLDKMEQKALHPYAQDLEATDTETNTAQADPKAIKIKNPYDVIKPQDSLKPSFPKTADLRFEGPYGLTATMNFKRTNSRYSINTVVHIPFNKTEFIAEGKIHNNQLQPQSYTHKRKGKVYASAVFDYDNQAVHYGKGPEPTLSYDITARQMDFFTWAWQMSINGGILEDAIQLTNGKKVYEQNIENETGSGGASAFAIGEEMLFDTGEGKIRIILLNVDRTEKSLEDNISYGFAPDFANIPAMIFLNAGGKDYQLHIIGITLDGHDYWHAQRSTRKRK